jgi:Arc/MetJ-type ribon-helix-helix transcriptional regulator
MQTISVSLPPKLLKQLKAEAKKREMSLSGFVRYALAERSWRKRSPKEQHWLEAVYAKGKAKRKIKKFEDIFSD